MPYASDAQRRLFHSKNSPVSKATVREFDQASKGKALPEHVKKMAKGGPVIEDHPDHFLVHGKDRPYKVFKKGMSPNTVARFQKMAKGGVVKAADGYPAPSTDIADQVPEEAVNPAIFQAGQPQNFQADLTPPEPTKYDSRVNADIVADDGRSIPTNAGPNGVYSMDEQRARASSVVQPQASDANEPGLPAMPQLHTVGVSKAHEQAINQEGASAKAEQQAAAEGLAKQAVADEANRAAQAKAFETHQATVKDISGALQSEQEKYARMEVDPKQYWKDHSKVVSAIGVLLSGIGQGVAAAGGSRMANMAMEVINRQIEQSIDAQKANITKQGNVVHMMQQRLGNENAAYDATRAFMLQDAVLQAKSIANRSGSKQAMARADYLEAMAKEKIETLKQQAGNQAAMASYTNNMNAWKVAAQQQADLKSLPGRTAAMLAPLDQAQELLNHMEKSDAVKLGRASVPAEWAHGVPFLGNGRMPATEWELNVDMLSNELGKISSGGKAGEQEARGLREKLLSAHSTAQRKDAINSVRAYIEGQKKGVTRTLNFQGYRGAAPDQGGAVPFANPGAGSQQRGDEGG